MSYEADYVRKHLGEPLTLALTEICLKRPIDPMAYLAQWLLHYQRVKGRYRPSKEEQRKEFEEEVASARGSEAGFAKMDDFWYEGHELETSKGETEFGYPFSLVAGDAEDTASLERRRIEKMIREMVGQEVARFVPSASSREGSEHSLEEMLKEQIFKRILEETEVPRAVQKEPLESLEPGYRELARELIDELLKEENLQRAIADKVGVNDLKEGDSFERMIKEEVLRRVLGDSRQSLGSASKDEHWLEEMLKEQIFRRMSEETERNSFERMIKEEVLRRVLGDSRQSLGSASKDEDDIIWKVVAAGIGKGSSDFDLEAEVDQRKASREELRRSTLEVMLKEEIARIIMTTKRQERVEPERDQDDAERAVEEARYSLAEILKYDIIQKINAAGVEKGGSRVDLESECAIKRSGKDGKRISLEEILKDEIIQRMIAAGVAKSISEVDVEAGIEQVNEEGRRDSLVEMLKDEIIEKIIATRVAKTVPEVNLASGRADDGIEQANEEGQRNSLEEMLKDQIIRRVIGDRMQDSATEVNLQDSLELDQGRERAGASLVDMLKDQIIQKLMSAKEQDLTLENLADKDASSLKTNSFEDNLKEQILQRLNASRSGVSDAKGEEAEVEGNSLEEALKEQIYQLVVALQNGGSVDKMADFVTHVHGEGTDVEEPSLEEDIKRQIFGRILADEGDSIEGGIGVKGNVGGGRSLEGKDRDLERMEAVKVSAAEVYSNEGVEELEGQNTVRKEDNIGAGLVRIVVTKDDETQTDDEKQSETDSSQPIRHPGLAVEDEDEDIIPV